MINFEEFEKDRILMEGAELCLFFRDVERATHKLRNLKCRAANIFCEHHVVTQELDKSYQAVSDYDVGVVANIREAYESFIRQNARHFGIVGAMDVAPFRKLVLEMAGHLEEKRKAEKTNEMD